MSANTKLTAIANNIRTINGGTGALSLDAMASNLDDVIVEIDTQTDLIAQIQAALEESETELGPAVCYLNTTITGATADSYINFTSYVNGNYIVNRAPVYYLSNSATTQSYYAKNVVCGSMITITGYQDGTAGITLPGDAKLIGTSNAFTSQAPGLTLTAPTTTIYGTLRITSA